jgi:hypothetical protein
LDPKALFHANHGISRGTPALCRLICYRLENGAGRRGLREAIAPFF